MKIKLESAQLPETEDIIRGDVTSEKFDMPLPVSIGVHFFGWVAITVGAACSNGCDQRFTMVTEEWHRQSRDW